MKVVITGGAGFIGSHIVDYWLNNKAEVHIIDNLRSGYKENIRNLNDVNFHLGSINDKELVLDVLKNTTYVFNLAAMVSVPESMKKPIECIKINVGGLINLLEAARKYKVKKFIHSSSAAVYGDDPALPKKITMMPKPKTPYGITKLDGELYSEIYCEKGGLGALSLRYFNVYGPKQNPKSQYAAAIPLFISNALLGKDIIIFGDGEQTRDFIYVEDVVRANVIAAERILETGVYNVASGEPCKIINLARLIKKLTKSKSKIIFTSPRSGDIFNSHADIRDTSKELGFEPETKLVDGLNATIDYFRKKMT